MRHQGDQKVDHSTLVDRINTDQFLQQLVFCLSDAIIVVVNELKYVG